MPLYWFAYFQVGSSQQIGVSADAVQILINAGLMALDPSDGSHVITKSGFQFLLMETASQVKIFTAFYGVLSKLEFLNISIVL